MTELATAQMLTRYNAWANQLFFDAVQQLPEPEATKPRVSLFSNMVHTLNHNYVIDRIFRAHLLNVEHGYERRNTDAPPLSELWRAQQELDTWYVEYFARVSEEALSEKVHFTFVGGGEGVMTRSEILIHVVNHTSYHRGFVADLFYQVPATPPVTDLPVFLREQHART
jgi:uncharacterized damage-inducible protein DinB